MCLPLLGLCDPGLYRDLRCIWEKVVMSPPSLNDVLSQFNLAFQRTGCVKRRQWLTCFEATSVVKLTFYLNFSPPKTQMWKSFQIEISFYFSFACSSVCFICQIRWCIRKCVRKEMQVFTREDICSCRAHRPSLTQGDLRIHAWPLDFRCGCMGFQRLWGSWGILGKGNRCLRWFRQR